MKNTITYFILLLGASLVNSQTTDFGDGTANVKLRGVPPTGGEFNIGQTSSSGKINFVSKEDLKLMTILNNGHIGIGLSNPSSKIDIELSSNTDFLRIRRFSSSGRSQMVFADENAAAIWRIGMTGGGNSNFAFFNGSRDVLSMERNGNLVLDPENNVGIGVNIPSKKLDIALANETDFMRIRRSSSTGRSQMVLADENASEIWRIGMTGAGTSNFAFWNGTRDVLKMERSGNLILNPTNNVGIGTETPTHLLTLNGGVHPDGAKTLVFERQQSGGAYNDIKASLGISGNTSQGGLRFTMSSDDGSTWSDAFFIQAGGNVGIGTPNPDSKLTVAGKIHSQEVKVSVSAGADFVFEEGYGLWTLEETEEFVKTNKHLPGIASEEEMTQNGLEVGEMNIRLLQKIEELTLYLIEQNKEINALKEEVAGLRKSK